MTLLGHPDSGTDAPTPPPRCHWLTTTTGTDMVNVVILLRWRSALPDERHRGRAPTDTQPRRWLARGQTACNVHSRVRETAAGAPYVP
jgi:hypothetical protein